MKRRRTWSRTLLALRDILISEGRKLVRTTDGQRIGEWIASMTQQTLLAVTLAL